MAEIQYRYYQSGDEQHIVELWNRSLHKDPINLPRFRKLVLLDANFDPEGLRTAWNDDQLVGCCYAIRRQLPMRGTELEPDNGWIPWFFVSPSNRSQGIGLRLLQEAEQFLVNKQRKNIFFASYAPNYILPGIDEESYPHGYQLLLKQGFSIEYSPVAMDFSLIGYEIPEDVKNLKRVRMDEGYSFNSVEDKDLYELIQFVSHVFNPDWSRAIREGILQGLPLPQIIIARNPQKKVVGFTMYGGYEGLRERFGPFGVDPSMRGKGIGKILLHDCLFAQRAESLHGSWFLWTEETSAAGYLYKKVGFTVSRKFHVMRKTIE